MNDVLRVNGGIPLRGEISVRGAKNFVSKAMVAALLGESTSVLRNVPQIRDVEIVSQLLNLHGVAVSHDQEAGILTLDPTRVEQALTADIGSHSGSSRISILYWSPVLH